MEKRLLLNDARPEQFITRLNILFVRWAGQCVSVFFLYTLLTVSINRLCKSLCATSICGCLKRLEFLQLKQLKGSFLCNEILFLF